MGENETATEEHPFLVHDDNDGYLRLRPQGNASNPLPPLTKQQALDLSACLAQMAATMVTPTEI